MSQIPRDDLIAIFQQMYREHWSYELGKAEKGCVDCSGAFVYAYNQFGKKIAHGSNSIAHKYVSELLPISKAEPGMAAFKVRDWTADQSGNSWYMQEPGDVHHIGLVDTDTKYVLNAKGTNYGFCRDKLTTKNGWDYVGYLLDVDYAGGGGGGGTVETVTVYGGNLDKPINMRQSASTSSKIIEEIPQYSTASLISDGGGWCKLTYDGVTGYVKDDFVHTDSPSPTPTPTGDTVEVPVSDLVAIDNLIRGWIGKG